MKITGHIISNPVFIGAKEFGKVLPLVCCDSNFFAINSGEVITVDKFVFFENISDLFSIECHVCDSVVLIGFYLQLGLYSDKYFFVEKFVVDKENTLGPLEKVKSDIEL